MSIFFRAESIVFSMMIHAFIIQIRKNSLMFINVINTNVIHFLIINWDKITINTI